MILPSSIETGLVHWQVKSLLEDSSDPDRDPDLQAIPNVTVTFTPSVSRTVSPDPLVPFTIIMKPITAKTNFAGVLVGPDGNAGVRLVASDNELLNPTGFTYQVTISGAGTPITVSNVRIPKGQTVDLSYLVPVPTSMGTALTPIKGDQGIQGPEGPIGPIGPTPQLSIGEVVTGLPNPGPIGPIGPKGDPGGFNLGTPILDTHNLNDIRNPGLYHRTQPPASWAELNYPALQTGLLMVQNYGGGAVHQTFEPMWQSRNARLTWKRSYTNVWSPWYVFPSQRVDQTAGRAIYTWDDVNNREQLIYGDTGWRNLTTLLAGVSGGSLTYRRTNYTAEFLFESLAFTDQAIGSVYTLPSGDFYAHRTGTLGIKAADKLAGDHLLTYRYNGVTTIEARSTSAFSGYISFPLRTGWPTTLPGTASGSIPNT